jgi:uncharacterized SAM-binding protein YcdF (DUF218 family)
MQMSRNSIGLPADIYQNAELLFRFNQLDHEVRPCDVAIGLGSHDLGVADVTADLFHRGLFPLIVFTGANAATTRERFPEGEAVHYRRRAMDLGVPSEAILVERRATNTAENIEFSRELLADHEVHPQSALLICRPYQQRRAYATCRKVWPSLEALCASDSRTFDDYVASIGDATFVINMIVGDTERVIEYPKLGRALPEEVPAHIEIALKRLVAMGFTQRSLWRPMTSSS